MKKCRKFLCYMLISSLFFCTNFSPQTSQAAAKNDISVYLNGSKLKFDVQPYIKKGRTMVPFRKIFESFGVDISWNAASKTILANNSHTDIFLQINKTEALVNGFKTELDVAAEIIEGRTFVPLRFVSENTGAEVNWDGSSKTVYISYVFEKHKLGETSHYKDLEFSINNVDIVSDGKIITIVGKTNLPEKFLLIEAFDESGRYETGLISITGQQEDKYRFESNLYLTKPFKPKTIVVKTTSDANKQIKISEYNLN
ncbi:MAG TPA: copper amine oxidase N-terminal domain-containing protein [Pseudobacteroides sp.]|uniref:copper amine oxidase N-terminal domain-containing protein n=1 Tax=Pseudobacteroides sp. TaxID=1968840 RepID=UPI002F95A5F6